MIRLILALMKTSQFQIEGFSIISGSEKQLSSSSREQEKQVVCSSEAVLEEEVINKYGAGFYKVTRNFNWNLIGLTYRSWGIKYGDIYISFRRY